MNTAQQNFNQNILCSILEGNKPIENLISYWIKNSRYMLTLGPEESEDIKEHAEDPGAACKGSANFVMVLDNQVPVHGTSFSATALKKSYKKVDSWFEPIVLADSGEVRLPYELVEEHRIRNGTKWDDEAGINIIRPSFVGNICLSYLLDNRGIVMISSRLLEDEYNRVRDYYIIEIIHLGVLPGNEKYAVLKEKLDVYASR
jgi:hypothetical protein